MFVERIIILFSTLGHDDDRIRLEVGLGLGYIINVRQQFFQAVIGRIADLFQRIKLDLAVKSGFLAFQKLIDILTGISDFS